MAIPVKGYEKYYLIYPNGDVYSKRANRFMRPSITKKGYKSIELFGDRGSERKLIHRLVAEAYIPNPQNLPQVNHKDENPSNNNVENLEWCTAKYNMSYGRRSQNARAATDWFYKSETIKETARKNGKAVCKPVIQLDLYGRVIQRFESAKAASVITGVDQSHLLDCCKHKPKRKTAGGYKWEYEREVV